MNYDQSVRPVDVLQHLQELDVSSTGQSPSVDLEVSLDRRDDRAAVLAAVSGNGLALRFASNRLRADRGVALAACPADGRALVFADDTFLVKATS